LVFNVSRPVQMSYANCNLFGLLAALRIAYTSSDGVILDYLPSLDNDFTQTVRGKLQHFSEYAIAW